MGSLSWRRLDLNQRQVNFLTSGKSTDVNLQVQFWLIVGIIIFQLKIKALESAQLPHKFFPFNFILHNF